MSTGVWGARMPRGQLECHTITPQKKSPGCRYRRIEFYVSFFKRKRKAAGSYGPAPVHARQMIRAHKALFSETQWPRVVKTEH